MSNDDPASDARFGPVRILIVGRERVTTTAGFATPSDASASLKGGAGGGAYIQWSTRKGWERKIVPFVFTFGASSFTALEARPTRPAVALEGVDIGLCKE